MDCFTRSFIAVAPVAPIISLLWMDFRESLHLASASRPLNTMRNTLRCEDPDTRFRDFKIMLHVYEIVKAPLRRVRSGIELRLRHFVKKTGPMAFMPVEC